MHAFRKDLRIFFAAESLRICHYAGEADVKPNGFVENASFFAHESADGLVALARSKKTQCHQHAVKMRQKRVHAKMLHMSNTTTGPRSKLVKGASSTPFLYHDKKKTANLCLGKVLQKSSSSWCVLIVQSEVGYATQVSTKPLPIWSSSRKDPSDWSTVPFSTMPAQLEHAPARHE